MIRLFKLSIKQNILKQWFCRANYLPMLPVLLIMFALGCAEDPEGQTSKKNDTNKSTSNARPLSQEEWQDLTNRPYSEPNKNYELSPEAARSFVENQRTQQRIIQQVVELEKRMTQSVDIAKKEHEIEGDECVNTEFNGSPVTVDSGDMKGCVFTPKVVVSCENSRRKEKIVWGNGGASCPMKPSPPPQSSLPPNSNPDIQGACLGLPNRECEKENLPVIQDPQSPVSYIVDEDGTIITDFDFNLLGFRLKLTITHKKIGEDGDQIYIHAIGEAPVLGKLEGELRISRFSIGEAPREKWTKQQIQFEGSYSYKIKITAWGGDLTEVTIGPIKTSNAFDVDLCTGAPGQVVGFIDDARYNLNQILEEEGRQAEEVAKAQVQLLWSTELDSGFKRDMKEYIKNQTLQQIRNMRKQLQSALGTDQAPICQH